MVFNLNFEYTFISPVRATRFSHLILFQFYRESMSILSKDEPLNIAVALENSFVLYIVERIKTRLERRVR